MGQKVHPRGFRTGINKPWLSFWIADDDQVADLVHEDYIIRKFITKQYATAGISRVEIKRKAQNVYVAIITAKPGVVVGRGGAGIDALRKGISKLINKRVQIDVLEVERIDRDATLVGRAIADQLEKRVPFRRVMKHQIQRSMRAGVLGIKIAISGRLGGAEIARTEWTKEGRIPLQTLRADIDYGFVEANTVFGKIGVKVWIFKGEIMKGESADTNVKPKNTPDNSGFSSKRSRGKN